MVGGPTLKATHPPWTFPKYRGMLDRQARGPASPTTDHPGQGRLSGRPFCLAGAVTSWILGAGLIFSPGDDVEDHLEPKGL
jgi:hypothetical protein